MYISEDPAPDGNNYYAYVGNNPLTSTDPTGLDVGNPGNDGWNKEGKPITVDSNGNQHESGHGMIAKEADANLRDKQ